MFGGCFEPKMCFPSKRERRQVLFYHVTMDHLIEYNWMRVWSTLNDPHPPLTWRSSGIKGHFQQVFTPQCRSIFYPNLATPQTKRPTAPAPLVSETNDDLPQWWSSEKLEDQLIGRSWVLKFFPSQNSPKSSENPSENKTLPGVSWLQRATGFDIHTFPWAYSSLGCLFLTSLAGWVSQIHLLYKSNYFWKGRNRDKGMSHWKLAHTSRNSKTSSAQKKLSPAFTNLQKKRSPL